MIHHSYSKTRILISVKQFTFSLCALFITLLFVMGAIVAHAASYDMSGNAWSSTIGWISVDGAGYAVAIDSDTNLLSGYAWSNLGWLKFGGLSGCPGSGSCDARLNVSTNEIEGWARFCAGTEFGDCSTMTDHPDGWDGWVSFNCSNTSSCGTSDYGWTLSGDILTGFAWGGDVVGWIVANNINIGVPPSSATVGVRTLGSADPLTTTSPYVLTAGEEIEIEWDSADTTGCLSISGTDFSTGGDPDGVDDSVTEPALATSETFSIACTGIVADSVASIDVEYPAVNILLWTEPAVVEINDTVELKWDVTGRDPATCSISGPDSFSHTIGATATTGSYTSDQIKGESSFVLTCLAGGVNPDISVETKVQIPGVFVED